MTFRELVKELCRREGNEHGVNVADMSEIVRCLGDILLELDDLKEFNRTIEAIQLGPKASAKAIKLSRKKGKRK